MPTRSTSRAAKPCLDTEARRAGDGTGGRAALRDPPLGRALPAQGLRESPAAIAQIAAEVGYESESTFARAFTRTMRTAPGAFRRGGGAG